MSIASTNITCIAADGRRFDAIIEIGTPYVVSEGESVCSVDIPGVSHKKIDIRGNDTLQALCLALRWARFELDEFVKHGGRIVAEDFGEPLLEIPPGIIVSVGSIIGCSDEYPEYNEEVERRSAVDHDERQTDSKEL